MSDKTKIGDEKKRVIASSVSGAVDPEIREAGERFGQWIVSLIPDDSWLKSKACERVFGVLRQWAENQIQYLGPVGSAVAEKITDLLDHASGEVFGRGTERHGDDKDESASMLEKATNGWMQDFFKDVAARFKAAPVAEHAALRERIVREFQVRAELIKQLKEEFAPKPGAKPADPTTAISRGTSKSWSKALAEWEGELEMWRKQIKRRRAKTKKWEPHSVVRFFAWPFTFLFRIIFGGGEKQPKI